MRLTLIISLLTTLLILSSCNNSTNPKETAKDTSQSTIPDSVLATFDPIDTLPSAYDSLEQVDSNVIGRARALSSLNEFVNSIVTEKIHQNITVTAATRAAYQLQYSRYFLNDKNLHFSDSLISTLEDSLEAKKQKLINHFFHTAYQIKFRKDLGLKDSINGQPIRAGVKYGYGVKEYRQKRNPFIESKGKSSCNHYITSLDCSGFIYQLFLANDIKKFPKGNAEIQRQPSTLKNALIQYFSNSTRFDITNFKLLPVNEIKFGDIFYDLRKDGTAHHIAIVLLDGTELLGYDCDGDVNSCDMNISKDFGVRAIKLKDYVAKYHNYGIVRIVINSE
jgi:hypothetical protein